MKNFVRFFIKAGKILSAVRENKKTDDADVGRARR
jgi:hypothetical protein